MRLYLCLCLYVVSLGCRTQPPLKKEASKTKTEFTIPANSVFSFEKGEIKLASSTVAVSNQSKETQSVDSSGVIEQAKADALFRFYIVGGILALIGAFLLWKTHGKAGWFAIGGALLTPLLAKFYSSDAAQYVALASLCIAGALFGAWHLLKNRLRQE